MEISTVFNQALILFIPIIVGYVIAKIKLVDDSFIKNLSAFVFNVTMPCTIVTALRFEITRNVVSNSLVFFVISSAIIFFSWLLGTIVARFAPFSGYLKKILRFSLIFSNFGFMGYPIAEMFFGAEGFFYSVIFSIPLHITVQSLGTLMLNPNERKEKTSRFKPYYIINPPMVGVFVGLFLLITKTKPPYALDRSIQSFGLLTTPLAMSLAGLILSKAPIKSSFTDIKCYAVSLLRLVILPASVYAVLSALGFGGLIARLPAVISMMPIAANLVITVSYYEADSLSAARFVLISTILSLATIPVMARFLLGI